jgi:asparagine synthase (glutamine-hydrolysing)
MCGIYGIYNFGSKEPANKNLLDAMGKKLAHRGPDDSGVFYDGCFAMGMRRLSIIDLKGGHQPLNNEKEDIFLVCNGEIYNYKSLTKKLSAKGHKFKTKTDAETIIHLYEDYGLDCLKYLRGMFAFALWDKTRQLLLIARDRLGKKPLNFSVYNGQFGFASELQSLVELKIPKKINPAAIDYFLTLQYIPSPLTIYQNIEQLPPAHFLVMQKGQLKIKKYWDLPLDKKTNLTVEEAKSEIARRLNESVKLRLEADVEVGSFLSGGTDSSIITAMASRLSSKPLKTFTIGFEDKNFSELKYARKIANYYDCNHTEFIVKPEAADILPKLVRHYGQPFADPSALPSFYLARETAKHVKTALNGDGGDENFAGYLRYPAMKLAKTYMKLPQFMKTAVLRAFSKLKEKNAPYGFNWRLKRFLNSAAAENLSSAHLNMSSFFNYEEKNAVYSEQMKQELQKHNCEKYIQNKFAETENTDFINRLLYTDIKTYLPECLLTKIDIASMANSLEVRSPFLDHKFMEFVFGLQGSYKLKGFDTKWILKETFAGFMPPGFFNRPKMGFGIPLGNWFRGSLKNYWQDICLSQTALKRGYFNPDAVKDLWRQHQSGKFDHGYKLWALLILELWCQSACL